MAALQKGSTALITGAASGIGLATAKILSSRGMNLALVDSNKALLDRAKAEFPPATSETYEVDVSKIEQWGQLKEKVDKRFGAVDFLMLNAGIGLKSGWNDQSYFQKIYGLNTFVDSMQSSGKAGTIVMTGSKQGITNPPGNPAYNASKAAVKTLAEHLHYDLRSSPLTVHLLVPGWVFTGLSGNIPGGDKKKPDGAWAPEQCAEFLLQKIEKGKDAFWILCPDNDVTEDKDKRRMLWTAGDAVYSRPPLSRWRPETKDEAEKWMSEVKI